MLDTRNYLTHYEKDDTFYVLEGIELNEYSHRLFSLLKYLLCNYLGIGEDTIRKNILKDRDDIAIFKFRNS